MFDLLAQTTAPAAGGLQLPQFTPTQLLLGAVVLGFVAYLYFSNRDAGRRRHNPGKRRGEKAVGDCGCPPMQQPGCVPAYETITARKPYVVYLDDDGCCGSGGVNARDLQSIADQDAAIREGERRGRLAERMGQIFPPPADPPTAAYTDDGR